MAYHHRKLIQESTNISVSDLLCPSYCDPTNDLGFCPPPCLSICSSICHYPLSFPMPPLYNPTPSTDQPSRIHRLFPFLIVTLAVLVSTFLLVCHYSIYVRFYTRRRRSQSAQPQSDNHDQTTREEFLDEEHGPELDHPIWYIRTVGLQPSVISAITICKYKRDDGLVDGTECSVCLSEFEEDEILRLLPKCNHAFHIPCIDTWLRSHTNCPMCRAGIVANIAARSPSPELNVDNSGISEETQVGISENSGESVREREDRVCELRNETEEESELRVVNERERCESSKGGVGGIQLIRRSVSMDSASASMISLAIANDVPIGPDINSENQLVKVSESHMRTIPKRSVGSENLQRLMGSSSIGRSQQNGSSSMKRSLSCTGKFLLSRHNRSRNSVLPL